MNWEQFLERMKTGRLPTGEMLQPWQPGEHIGIVAPTGIGKSTFATSLVLTRKYVLIPDAKGGDDTLSRTGFPRLTSWDKRKVKRQIDKNDEDGKPSRFVLGIVCRTRADRERNRALLDKALPECWEMGGWTVYVPDLQLVTDRRFYGLGDHVEEMLIAARNKKISVVTDWQRPANVPRAAGDQTRFLAVGYTRDRDVIDRLAEMLGRTGAEIRGAIKGLGGAGKYHWLVSSPDPFDPLIVTRSERTNAGPRTT
jgi:hypothetical protein